MVEAAAVKLPFATEAAKAQGKKKPRWSFLPGLLTLIGRLLNRAFRSDVIERLGQRVALNERTLTERVRQRVMHTVDPGLHRRRTRNARRDSGDGRFAGGENLGARVHEGAQSTLTQSSCQWIVCNNGSS